MSTFKGRIGRTYLESTPSWDNDDGHPSGGQRPNVVVVVFDDTGFAHFGCYGSSIRTPALDRLAAQGVRFSNFHTTALCSPTRASLLTGRNHHTVGMRSVAAFDTGFPNMRGAISAQAATLAEVLRSGGYGTYAIGKWHVAPPDQLSAVGPFDNWPLQRGFDRYYGFHGGATDQFFPELIEDNHHISPPGRPEDGYHLTEDLVSHSIDLLRNHTSLSPRRPFLLYLGLGATHAPHQAPDDYIARSLGRFDEGWDVLREQWYSRQLSEGIIPPGTRLAPRNPGVQAWNSLSEDERLVALRLQEVFSAFLEHADDQIARLVSYLTTAELIHNTIIIVLSDNGASVGGGPTGILNGPGFFHTGDAVDISVLRERIDQIGRPFGGFNDIPWGWAQAGNTPLKWYKGYTHGGGVRDPLIVHWPAGVSAPGRIEHEFLHVSDVMPTILECVSLEAPDNYAGVHQIPMSGKSFAELIAHDNASRVAARTQYFEMMGHRAIWKDGWKAVTRHQAGSDFDADEWELYHVAEDFSEETNLVGEFPEKLSELVTEWWLEAGRFGVLPLDDRGAGLEFARVVPAPGSPHDVEEYRYVPPLDHIPTSVAPPLGARSWIAAGEVGDVSPGDTIFASGTSERGATLAVVTDRLLELAWFESGIRRVVASRNRLPLEGGSFEVYWNRVGDSAEVSFTIGTNTERRVGVVQGLTRRAHWGGLDIGYNRWSTVPDRGTRRQVADIRVIRFALEGTTRHEVLAEKVRGELAEQ